MRPLHINIENQQETATPLYLLFEFMQVDSHSSGESWQVEDFWSGIHRQRVADKSIIGWDLWTLTPNGTKQGSQYLTVTIFATLQQMLQAKDDFKMKVGTMLTMDIMKQLDDSYEAVESEIFKPWHQEMVDKGKKGSWELLRTILPSGSEAYGTHLTISMYQDAAQLASFLEGGLGKMDLKTRLAVKEGLKTRDWREVKFATLQMMVR